MERRDTAPGTLGSYELLCLLCMHLPVPLSPAIGAYLHDTHSGKTTPRQHQRREATSTRLAVMPLRYSLAGEPVIVPFSALTKWQHVHRPFNHRSLYDPRCDKRCRARDPWSAPEPYTLQEPSRYHKGSWVLPPVVTVPTAFVASDLPNFAPCRTQSCFPRTAAPTRRIVSGANEPKRGPKSAPLPKLTVPHFKYLGRRGVRVSPLPAGGEGPTQSHLWIQTEPGKLAEGSQYLTSYHNGSSYAQTTTVFCSSLAKGYRPWGKLFHRFRFRYLLSFRRQRRHSARPSPSLTNRTTAAPSATARSAKLGQLAAARPGAGRALFFSLLYFYLIDGVRGSPHPATQGLVATAPVARKRAWIRVNRQTAAGRPAWYRHLLVTEPQIQLATAGLHSRAPRRGAVSRPNVTRRPRDAVAYPSWSGNHLGIEVTCDNDCGSLGDRSDLGCQLVQERLSLFKVIRLSELILPDPLIYTEEFNLFLLQRDLDPQNPAPDHLIKLELGVLVSGMRQNHDTVSLLGRGRDKSSPAPHTK